MNQLTFDRMYRASCEKDPEFEGLFWMGVKTTGIFCRPTCTARKPLPENVEFFTDSRSAITRGYRACKICKPLELPSQTPAYIERLLSELRSDPSLRLRDGDLRERGIEPATLRRWFLKHHGMTFHAFARMQRINTAFRKLQQQSTVTDSAMSAGFDSLSGFGDRFREVFGVAPSSARVARVLHLQRMETPLGTMIGCASDAGLCLLEFSDRKALETELLTLARKLNATIIQAPNAHLTLLAEELRSYFAGELQKFTVPLERTGTDFQHAVWDALVSIPYGTTRSYAEQAVIVGRPSAGRAVANANGMNKIAIVIPCHRVIGADGKLTGYAGGVWRKQHLLQLERDALQANTSNSYTSE